MLAVAGLATGLGACGSSPTAPAAPVAPVAGITGIAAAPVRVAHTELGTVGYRVVGSGPPLVLIMGYAGTMQTWDPRFVNTLAMHNRVVIFDNAGIGDTQALPAPLTIDAMADQTSAFISTLGLGRTDVLGWSMGGMVAQALAVRHPAQVRRLVLCATFPGVGTVVPPQAAINALTSGNAQAVLFPADQDMAYGAFSAGIETYPIPSSAPAATIAAQGDASLDWFHGTDPAGRLTSRISAPTLIADGTEDRLDTAANSRTLARLITGSKLELYPDAGHAFLFQEGTPFAFAVESFLAGRPAPVSAGRIRSEFTGGEAQISATGKTWAAKLKALHSNVTAPEVTGITEPFASSLSDLDYTLLSSGATVKAADAITAFVTDNERFVNDILALAVQGKSTGAAWGTTIKKDGAAGLTATNGLRKVLGLPPVS